MNEYSPFGQSFDDYLLKIGKYEEVKANTEETVATWQIEQEMQTQKTCNPASAKKI